MQFCKFDMKKVLQKCDTHGIMGWGDDMNIGMRIKEIRKAKRISAETIAERLNVAPSTIYRYESGDIEKVSSTILEQIADALGVSPSVLMGWDNIVIPNVKRIPILGDTAAGLPITANREYDDFIEVPTDGKRFDAAVRVRGDSMEPNYRIGDLALIHYQEDVEDGQIAVVCLDDEVTFKRIYHNPNGIMLISDNPKYAPIHVTSDEVNNIHLTGRAVGVIHWEE